MSATETLKAPETAGEKLEGVMDPAEPIQDAAKSPTKAKAEESKEAPEKEKAEAESTPEKESAREEGGEAKSDKPAAAEAQDPVRARRRARAPPQWAPGLNFARAGQQEAADKADADSTAGEGAKPADKENDDKADSTTEGAAAEDAEKEAKTPPKRQRKEGDDEAEEAEDAQPAKRATPPKAE